MFEDLRAIWEDLDSSADLGRIVSWRLALNGIEKRTSPISLVDSRTVTLWPASKSPIAAPNPPSPAPTTTIYRFASASRRKQLHCICRLTSILVSSSLTIFSLTLTIFRFPFLNQPISPSDPRIPRNSSQSCSLTTFR